MLVPNEIIFLCRNFPGNINYKIIENGFNLIELPPLEKEYFLESNLDESVHVKNILANIGPDLIIVDHYGLDKSWETMAKMHCRRIVVIDDLGREHNANIILDQNFRTQIPRKYQVEGIKLFLGPEFCILSKKFQMQNFNRNTKAVKNVLCFLGGSDNHSITLRLAKLFSQSSSLQWNFAVGKQNRDIDALSTIASTNINFEVHQEIKYMDKLIKEADLFIGAGGTTTWERAFYGLPSIVISVAQNQIEINQHLHNKNVVKYLGHYDHLNDNDIIDAINELSEDQQKRDKLVKNSLSLNVSKKLNYFVKYILSSS